MDCIVTGGNVKGSRPLLFSPIIKHKSGNRRSHVCVSTVQCWPKQSILCPGSVTISMLSLRKMGWAPLILSSIHVYFLFQCISSACFRLVHTLCQSILLILLFFFLSSSSPCGRWTPLGRRMLASCSHHFSSAGADCVCVQVKTVV